MPKKMLKKSAYLGVFILFLNFVVSCEKDFTDIGTTVIKNTKFETKEVFLEVEMTTENISSVRADNIELGNAGLGEYLLGVYKKQKDNVKKIEASIVSQVTLPFSLDVTDRTLEAGESFTRPTLDEVILQIPLKVSNLGKQTVEIEVNGVKKDTVVPKFSLDSLLGDPKKDFNINIYQNGTYLNRLNPNDPSKLNSFQSNKNYLKTGPKLNPISTYNLENVHNDTLFIYERTNKEGLKYKDTLKLEHSTDVTAAPFLTIRLDKNEIKTLLFDKYSDTELSSQDKFNDYFRGIIIEATGADGSLFPVDLSFSQNILKPSIILFHTSYLLDADDKIIETYEKADEFFIGGGVAGVSGSVYNMTLPTNNLSNTNIVQGTAGYNSNIKILGIKTSDLDQNKNPYLFSIKNTGDINNDGYIDLQELIKIEEDKNILINEASLNFYINKNTSDVDTLKAPKRLLLYKDGVLNNKPNPTHLWDIITEGNDAYGGFLNLTDGKPDNYKFILTDYIATLLRGKNTDDNIPNLKLKVFNSSDLPRSRFDTIIKTYNWNPRSAPILNHSQSNGARKARIKVSYSIEK